MSGKNKDYNVRKLQVLKLAARMNGKLTVKDVQFNLGVTPLNARQLLFHYRNEDLFTHPKRGTYRLAKRGRARLTYLETRQQISKVTGVDIGLNHHKPLPVSVFKLADMYRQATGGQPFPSISL